MVKQNCHVLPRFPPLSVTAVSLLRTSDRAGFLLAGRAAPTPKPTQTERRKPIYQSSLPVGQLTKQATHKLHVAGLHVAGAEEAAIISTLSSRTGPNKVRGSSRANSVVFSKTWPPVRDRKRSPHVQHPLTPNIGSIPRGRSGNETL